MELIITITLDKCFSAGGLVKNLTAVLMSRVTMYPVKFIRINKSIMSRSLSLLTDWFYRCWSEGPYKEIMSNQN